MESLPREQFFSKVSIFILIHGQKDFQALSQSVRDKLDKLVAGCKSFPALLVNTSLVLVVSLVVAHNIVAVWPILKLVKRALLSAFVILWHDVIRVKHGVMICLLIQSE